MKETPNVIHLDEEEKMKEDYPMAKTFYSLRAKTRSKPIKMFQGVI